jgi:signal transduction histidine kinase
MVGAYVPDRDASVLRPLAGYHVPPGLVEPFRAFPFPLRGHPFLEDAVRRGAPAFVSNPVLDPRIDRAILERFPAASVLFVPMLANGELLGGLFAVWWTLREAPPADEMRLAEAIARQATLAVANARLFGVSEERRRVAKTLGEVVHLLSSSLEPTVVAERIVDSVRGLLRAPSAALFRLDPESKALVAVAVSGALTAAFGPAFRFPPGTGAVGVAARTRRPLVTPDVLDDPHIVLTPQMRERLAQAGLGATLAVPLLVKGEVIGALGLADHKGRLFEPEEILLVQTLADEGAVALENARLFESSRVAVEAQKALARRVVEVQENERHHVARELHDEIGQLLTGITFALDAIPRGSGRRAGSLAQARELAQEAIARVREMALDLRPPMLDDLGLFPTLMWHVERFTRQTGIRVEVKQSGLEHRRFAAEVESAVYRIVQEALTNVARHAGVAEATVRLLADTLAIRVDVEDRGVGFETAALLDAPTSIGLAGMRERARLLGGEFRVDSTPGVATILSVELPLTGPRGGPPEAP